MTLTDQDLLDIYWLMLLSRRLDERAWVLHRQGKITFHISAIGHEAAQAATARAFEHGKDWFVSYYRDLTLMLALGLTPREFVLGLMGKKGEPSSGARQMPSHWSMRSMNVVSHSSPVATQTTHATGIGLGIKLRGDDAVVLTSIGEGSTSQGEWYEGVNWAAIHSLPVIFLVENNTYAISVPQDRQMAVDNVADKATGLGLAGITVDGTDVHSVYSAMAEAVARARAGDGPTLIETLVHRMTPHSSDDDDRSYRTREEVEDMKLKDSLERFQAELFDEKLLDDDKLQELLDRAKNVVDDAIQFGEAAPYPDLDEARYPIFAEDVRERVSDG